MIRRISVIASMLVAMGGSPAPALILFLDLGSPATGVQGGPLDSSNPTISALPGQPITLHLWVIPDDDDNKVIAALGHDVVVSGSAPVTAFSYTIDNPQLGDTDRWSGIALAGQLNDGNKLVSDQRAIYVPTTNELLGGISSANLETDPGFDAASGSVYVARLDLQINPSAPVGSAAELRLAVGPLLIASVTTRTPAAEPIFFGYAAGAIEPANGIGVGSTSIEADATITVAQFGDSDGDGDVDLHDHTELHGCFVGPGAGRAGGCVAFDHDFDTDVDLADFGKFQLEFLNP